MTRLFRTRQGWAVLALAFAMLVPVSAHGAPPTPRQPLISDAVGDTGYVCFEGVSIFGLTARCGREIPQPPAPAADITQGDMSLEGTSLVFETTVVDLDDPAAHPDATLGLSMVAVTGNVTIRVDATRSFRQEPPYATVTVTNTSTFRSLVGPAAVTFDNQDNTVTWDVALGTINESIGHVCPSCRELRRGSTLVSIEATTTFREPMVLGLSQSDRALANRPYTIGDDG